MRVLRLASLFISILLFASLFAAQQPPQRDPQAVAILQQALAAMGGSVPKDSVATGTVILVAGSTTENGTIRILTRGWDQSAEQLQMPSGNRTVVYSRGFGNEVHGATATSLQLELVATSQSPVFPLAILAGALSNSDVALQYLGLEALGGSSAHHIRFWNTFASNPKLQPFAEFTAKELWIDAATGLPRKLFYYRRAARGAAPRIPLEVFYADYRNVGGVLYPFLIKKSLNGTPWITITLGSVVFNAGLTDADFPVE